jgi:microcystin-dependent protein
MAFFNWTKTAAPNGNSDPSVNFLENQAPSSLNDSSRALMAGLAQMIADQSGALVTTGTANAYSLATNSNFTSAAFLSGNMVAFTPHLTNIAGSPDVTITIDSQANIPIRSAPNTPIAAGTLIQGTPYAAIYNNTDGALYLQSFYGNPYNIPLGAGMDYWGTTPPNSAFAFPIGQQVSITTYASLFTLFGPNRYGTDTSSLFFLPNRNGRGSAQLDPTGTVLTAATISPNGNTLGGIGGAQTEALLQANLPAATLATAISDPGHNHPLGYVARAIGDASSGTGSQFVGIQLNNGADGTIVNEPADTGITASTQLGGSNVPHNNMQPTILCNYIIRII